MARNKISTPTDGPEILGYSLVTLTEKPEGNPGGNFKING